MIDPINILIFLWTIVLIKKLFFWTWLWQLKQYYTKRIVEHFWTAKGRKLIFNILNFAKLISILGIIFWYKPFIFIIVLIYFLEALIFGFRIIKKSFKYPVLTKKSILIILSEFLLASVIIFFLFYYITIHSPWFLISLLLFDIFSPLLFSFLVLVFRWMARFLQKRTINKAREKREKLNNLLVIGITGSYGKTSTKEILANVLSKKFRVFKTSKHQNTDPAVAQYMIDKLDNSYEVFVAEMGAYFRGGIKSACDFIQPKIGIITGINQQHLGLFGSMENLIKAEGGKELIESLPSNGLIIFNGENKYCRELYQKTKKRKKIYGFESNFNGIAFDVWADGIKTEKESSYFRVVCKDGDLFDFQTKLLGKHSILNILAACCAAKELDMTLEVIASACKKIKPFEKTMELKKGRRGVIIVDDTYSANPAGVFAALDYLKLYSGKKIIIMPCLIELGKAGKRIHQEIGQKIGKTCDLAVITTKDYFKEIKNGAVNAGMDQKNILFLQNPEKIFTKIKPLLKPENVILLESRVPKKLIQRLTEK